MFKKVKDFMIACDQPVSSLISEKSSEKFTKLYLMLITEEYFELIERFLNERFLAEPDFCREKVEEASSYLNNLMLSLKLDELNTDDKVKIADDLADIIYVSNGLANILGINMDLVNEEVHKSNMSKINELTGKADKNKYGKIIKPSSYFPPDIKGVLLGENI